MLDAFADREHVRVRGDKMVVDMDAAPDRQASGAREFDVGADADRHHNQRRGDVAPVLEADPLDLALAVNLGSIGAGQDRLAPRLERCLEQPPGRFVELPFHQRRHDVEHGHLHPAQRQAVRRLEPEQPAADHHCVPAGVGRAQHRADIVHVAEGYDTLQVMPRHRDDERVGTGREDERVIALDPARARGDGLDLAIDRDDGVARHQLDRIVGIPDEIVDHDVVERLVAGEQRREHDAVVVHVRLGAEDRDAIAGRIAHEDFLDGAAARHTVADDDEMRFGHENAQSSESQSFLVSVAKRSAR